LTNLPGHLWRDKRTALSRPLSQANLRLADELIAASLDKLSSEKLSTAALLPDVPEDLDVPDIPEDLEVYGCMVYGLGSLVSGLGFRVKDLRVLG